MSVKIRERVYSETNTVTWQADIHVKLLDGRKIRERAKIPGATSRSGALKWAHERERWLILHGHEHRRIEGALPGPGKPVPVHGVGSGTYLSQETDRHGAFSLYTVGKGSIERVYHWWNGAEFHADPAAAY